MKILFIGDIVGRGGRRAIEKLLPVVVAQREIDFTIANGENAAGGFGITPETAEKLFTLGIDCLTSGNHVWDKKDCLEYLGRQRKLLRPLNYPEAIGHGHYLGETPSGRRILIVNLQGRVFMSPIDCPFRSIERLLKRFEEEKIIIIDMHAEASSEKIAMGHFLNGRVSAVLGTHTHVQTADECVLSGGTAYITDVGMTGPFDSVIGMEKEKSIRRLITQQPLSIQPAKKKIRLNAVIIEIDEETGKASAIERICMEMP